ncbi:MAG: M48 family metallopeptidase [Actinomycetota bacterium]
MRARRVRLLVVVTLLFGALSAGAAIAATQSTSRARLSDYFTSSDIERSRAYRGTAYLLSFGGIGAALVAGAAIGLGPGLRRLGRLAQQLTGGRWPLEAIGLAAAVTIVVFLIGIPFAYGRYLHDRHWGLSTQSLGGFFADATKGVGFEVVLAVVTGLGFIAIVRALPRGWPAAAAGFAVGLTVLLVYVLPVVYEPLFNKFTPVEPDVRARVVAIAEHAGVKVGDVLVADASRRTTRLNAYVSGLGATKRVVLYDTLLARSDPKKVDLVVAHELGHVAHHDVLKGTIVGSVGAVAAVVFVWGLLSWERLRTWVGADGPGDPRWLPFLALVLAVVSFLALPAMNAFSRHMEAAADRAAINYTRGPATAIEVEVELARSNIADLEPNPFIRWAFYTHPPTLERIQIALDWRAAHPNG